MQILPLMAATSFEHRGPQCLLILTRSTGPPLDQFPLRVCMCPLCIINCLCVFKVYTCIYIYIYIYYDNRTCILGPSELRAVPAGAVLVTMDNMHTLHGEHEYGYSWGRPKWNIISYFRGYSMIFHLIRYYIPF